MKSNVKKFSKKMLIAVLGSGMLCASMIMPSNATNQVVEHENELIEIDYNLLRNSSFDNNGEHWLTKGGASFTQYPDAAADTGGWCGYLNPNSGDQVVYQKVNLKANTEYTVKTKVKMAAVGQTAILAVKNSDLSSTVIEKSITCSSPWVYEDIELTFNTGNNTTVSICTLKWSTDASSVTYQKQVYVDDMKVFENGKENENYEVLWADDFNGTSLDETKWDYELGHIRGVEQQHYVRSDDNVYVNNGELTIKATDRKESAQYTVGGRKVIYDSGSIRTHDRQEFLYGRLEMRAKLPKGQGVFPAFWTLGSDFVLDGMIDNMQGYGWPRCGEIDIMELTGDANGKGNKTVWQTIHTGDSDNDHKLAGAPGYAIANNFNDDYHIFGINWSKNSVEWYVDNKIVKSVTYENDTIAKNGLNKPHYIQLNLAMGGAWPGVVGTNLAGTTYDVDYVYYAQNEQQKADAAEYYETAPSITGASNQTMYQGEIPDLLNGMTTTNGYHLAYSIDNDAFFDNNAGNSRVQLLIRGEHEKDKLATLAPDHYTVYYTSIPDNVQTDASNPNIIDRKAAYKFSRKTMTLTVKERTFPDISLTGVYGEKLSTVALPEGWSWEAPDTVLSNPQATYTVNFSQNGFEKSEDITIQLVSADKTELSKLITKAKEYIQKDIYTEESINALKAKMTKAQAIVDKTSATKNDVASAIQGLNSAIAGLKEKPVVPPVVEDKYEMIEGNKVVIKVGEEATFRSDAPIEKFKEVLLDGKVVDSKYYVVKEGSTIVTLKPEFIKMLVAGNHTIAIVSTDGQAKTTFTVDSVVQPPVEQSKNPTGDKNTNGTITSPSTGDYVNTTLWTMLAICSGIGYALTLKKKKEIC